MPSTRNPTGSAPSRLQSQQDMHLAHKGGVSIKQLKSLRSFLCITSDHTVTNKNCNVYYICDVAVQSTYAVKDAAVAKCHVAKYGWSTSSLKGLQSDT